MPLLLLMPPADSLCFSSSRTRLCFFRKFNFNLGRRQRVARECKASFITTPDSFEVGRLIGSYGFMNVTSYSGSQSGIDIDYLPADVGRLRAQDVGEGSVKIRLYEGRITQGPLRGTPVIFKVTFHFIGSLIYFKLFISLNLAYSMYYQCSIVCKNLYSLIVGHLYIICCLQWLAFEKHGKYTAADYAKVTSEKMSKDRDLGEQKLWNPFEKDETIKRRRYFITKLLQDTFRGLAYMHDRDRLHQSLGPASVVLNTIVEKDAAYLVPRLRDLAFSVDIRTLWHSRYSEIEGDSRTLSEGLWRRARSAGAFTPMDKRAFGIADDIYEAGLLFAFIAFIPFCEAGVMDSLSLRRLLENTFQLDVQAMREYCSADDRLLEAVKFLDLGNGAGWELLQAMLNRDFRQRPIAEAVLNHRFMAGAFL
ncbi:hypothetical protein BUALT_Bualt06G0145900 [Buddleja alternifolia]|uniref:Protein kinase domain-containing protein n=1 Tax=Buddleja alternifolia TaxID=168488 RepID=A0AAV6XM31_9LAMI|nr:hypothetical protein BUALT_Bualt06G0145900 [Buddleja alternifolia]